MDGDISARFGAAQPVYAAHPAMRAIPQKKSVEALAGTCCWLAAHTFVPVYWTVSRSGVHTQRYEGQEPAAQTIFLICLFTPEHTR